MMRVGEVARRLAVSDTSYCNNCGRSPSPCRIREMMPAMRWLGITEPWEFRYYLCRWCQAAETRKNKRLKEGT